MAAEQAEFLTGDRVAKLHGAVVGAQRQNLAVGGESRRQRGGTPFRCREPAQLLVRRRVPHAEHSSSIEVLPASIVGARRRERLAVGEEENGLDKSGPLSGEGLSWIPSVPGKDNEASIAEVAVGQIHGREAAARPAGCGLPESHGAVGATAGEGLSTVREGQAGDALALDLESAKLPAAGEVPQQHHTFAVCPRGQDFAARREGEAEDALGMSLEPADLFAG